jgi:hypothetical protein
VGLQLRAGRQRRGRLRAQRVAALVQKVAGVSRGGTARSSDPAAARA